jgi:hypothetical protein
LLSKLPIDSIDTFDIIHLTLYLPPPYISSSVESSKVLTTHYLWKKLVCVCDGQLGQGAVALDFRVIEII